MIKQASLFTYVIASLALVSCSPDQSSERVTREQASSSSTSFASSSSTSSAEEKWSTFTSTEYGFSIDYPSTWQVADHTSGYALFTFFPEIPSHHPDAYHTYADKLEVYATASRFGAANHAFNLNESYNFSCSISTSSPIAGNIVQHLYCPPSDADESPWNHYIFEGKHNEELFVYDLSSSINVYSTADEDELNEIFSHMRESFRFITK